VYEDMMEAVVEQALHREQPIETVAFGEDFNWRGEKGVIVVNIKAQISVHRLHLEPGGVP
jgi:hypothetical protein